MIRVSQNILLLSSRLGSGWLKSGSTGMPERANARRSSATVDMATRLPKQRARVFFQLFTEVSYVAIHRCQLCRPGCEEGFDHRVELSRASSMKVMTAVHRLVTRVGYSPGQLGQSVLTDMAVGAPDDQGGTADPFGQLPPIARWAVAPALDFAGGAPVVLLAGPRAPGHVQRWIGGIGRGHVLQHQSPYQVGAGCGKQEGDEPSGGVTERNDSVKTEDVQQPNDVVTHQFEAVLPRPAAFSMATKIRSHHAEPLADQRREVTPISP